MPSYLFRQRKTHIEDTFRYDNWRIPGLMERSGRQ